MEEEAARARMSVFTQQSPQPVCRFVIKPSDGCCFTLWFHSSDLTCDRCLCVSVVFAFRLEMRHEKERKAAVTFVCTRRIYSFFFQSDLVRSTKFNLHTCRASSLEERDKQLQDKSTRNNQAEVLLMLKIRFPQVVSS